MIKLNMSGRKFVLLEIGIALVLLILFLGALNSVVYMSRVPIVTDKDIWGANETIAIEYMNGTSATFTLQSYQIQSIATYYNDKLYIAIPAVAGYDSIRNVRIYLNKTLGDLASRGLNYYEITISGDIKQVLNTTDPTYIALTGRYFAAGVASSEIISNIFTLYSGNWSSIVGQTINGTIDAGMFALRASQWGPTNEAYIFIGGNVGQRFTASYIVLDFAIYSVSEKPVLHALMEPIYSLFAAVYAVLLAVIKRVKEYVVIAFGGFASQFTLTGLIGDPVIALILTIIFITIVFLVIKPQKRLRL